MYVLCPKQLIPANNERTNGYAKFVLRKYRRPSVNTRNRINCIPVKEIRGDMKAINLSFKLLNFINISLYTESTKIMPRFHGRHYTGRAEQVAVR
jgi:hypothetical protein